MLFLRNFSAFYTAIDSGLRASAGVLYGLGCAKVLALCLVSVLTPLLVSIKKTAQCGPTVRGISAVASRNSVTGAGTEAIDLAGRRAVSSAGRAL
ncbi:hypothetical protein V5799_022850 [Amblyomma americanum]|uniref:Uncharacterized protein n=1 Tax=Amblyomma americanum TaxID=6943 RepID=A0AAQ4FJ86_AMBAM